MQRTKKLVSAVLLLVMVFGVFTPTALYANETISVTIDGEQVVFDDQAPVVVDSRTLVPVRGVFEMLGFDVDWDNDTRTAIIANDEYEIRITIDSDVFTTNGIEHTLDVPAQLIGGRTMVPIRLPLESVGFEVDWDGETATVVIITPVDEEALRLAEEEAARLAEEEAVQAALTEFTSRFNLAIVREILGTDFEVSLEETTFARDGRRHIWRSLDLQGRATQFNGVNAVTGGFVGTSTGDVMLVLKDNQPFLYIDFGNANDFLARLSRDDRAFIMFDLSRATPQARNNFAANFDSDEARDALGGIDFEVGLIERSWARDQEGRVSFFPFQQDYIVLTWRFLDLGGQTVNTSNLNANRSGNIFGSQTGDVFIVINSDGTRELHIDLGQGAQSPLHRSYHVIELN